MANVAPQVPTSMNMNNGYILCMDAITPTLEHFLRGRSKSIELPFTRESMDLGIPALAVKDGELIMTSYTRSEVFNMFQQYMTYVSEVGVRASKDNTPSYATTGKHFADILGIRHDRKDGTSVTAFWATVANQRAGLKRASKSARLQGKLGSGEAYFVTGFNDKNGVARPIVSMKKALSAAARTHFPKEWAAANEANCKDMRKAVKDKCGEFVYKQAEAVGKVGQMPTNSYTLSMVEGMHHTKIIRLARDNGCKGRSKKAALNFIHDNWAKLNFSTL